MHENTNNSEQIDNLPIFTERLDEAQLVLTVLSHVGQYVLFDDTAYVLPPSAK